MEHLARRFCNTDASYLLIGVRLLLSDLRGRPSPEDLESTSDSPANLETEGQGDSEVTPYAYDTLELFFGGHCWPELKQELESLQMLLLRIERVVGRDFDFSMVRDPTLDAWLMDLGKISDGFWKHSLNPHEPGPIGFFLHRRRVFERLDLFLQKIQKA